MQDLFDINQCGGHFRPVCEAPGACTRKPGHVHTPGISPRVGSMRLNNTRASGRSQSARKRSNDAPVRGRIQQGLRRGASMYAHARCMHTGLACPRVRWACIWASDLRLGRAESCGRQAAGECCQRLLEHCIHEWRPALAGQQRTQPDADGARRACLVACGRQAAGECCQRFCQRLHRLNIAASDCIA